MAHNKRRRTMSNTRLKDELIKLAVILFDVAQREINGVKKELNHLKSSVATINARYRKQKSRVKIPNKISDVTEGNADVAEGNAKNEEDALKDSQIEFFTKLNISVRIRVFYY